MLPPHRFDAQPPASRARHAPAPRACCWPLVVRENRFTRVRRSPAPQRDESSGPAQARSTASATPIPPPMHSDASPRFASR
ncbi:hypothetical protein, partial [Burkholderia cepacia]|uniref:hypothetical protein n=1 Tax=Burkholderia cepacia TaxID=292 RepID=UPI002AB1942A